MLVEEALEHDDLSDSWTIEGVAELQDCQASFRISEGSSLEDISRELSHALGVTDHVLLSHLPALLTSQGNNPLQLGLEQLKDDLIFAEDLVLYQEEVIDHLWESYTVLKSVIEQKDDVINQLYAEVTALKEKGSAKHRNTASESSFSGNGIFGMEESNKEWTTTAGDRTVEVARSKEEWRNWAEEKHKLVQAHNEVKASLINEIRTLRKSLNPNTEQTFLDLQRSESLRLKLEEELVKTQIHSDQLRSELSQLQIKLQESETEKSMIESDWQERYEALQDRLLAQKGGEDYGPGHDGGGGSHYSSRRNESYKPFPHEEGEHHHLVPSSETSGAVDVAQYPDPGVSIIGRLSLVESKVKLFDNKFNDSSGQSRSKGLPSRSSTADLTHSSLPPPPSHAQAAQGKQRPMEFPIDLSLRSSYPPGNGLYPLNNVPLPTDNANGIKQLAERINSHAAAAGGGGAGGGGGGGGMNRNSITNAKVAAYASNNAEESSVLKSIPTGGSAVEDELQQHAHAYPHANPHEMATYEEKRSGSMVSKASKAGSIPFYPHGGGGGGGPPQSMVLFEPSYPEYKPTASTSPPRRSLSGQPSNTAKNRIGSTHLVPSGLPGDYSQIHGDLTQRQMTLRSPPPPQLLSNSTNDHPLRSALRSDTLSKLNGKGVTMMTTRPYFKFNPKMKQTTPNLKGTATAAPGKIEEDYLGTNQSATQPRFMSNTSSSHKRTASWEANGPALTVSGRRVLLNRNSGGWKWK